MNPYQDYANLLQQKAPNGHWTDWVYMSDKQLADLETLFLDERIRKVRSLEAL